MNCGKFQAVANTDKALYACGTKCITFNIKIVGVYFYAYQIFHKTLLNILHVSCFLNQMKYAEDPPHEILK